MKRIAPTILLAVLGATLSLADLATVRSKLQSALVETDEGHLQITDFMSSEADIKDGAKEEVRSLLQVAEKCLHSGRKVVQVYGLMVFFLTTFREDSGDLIAPYVDHDIAPFLDSEDLAVKREAIVILGSTHPRPLPRALDLLSAHLADENNTDMEAGMIAGSLIYGRPSDAKSVRDVLDFVSRHPEFKLRIDMIRIIGLNKVTTEEAVTLVHEGIADPDVNIRRISVEAAGRMPPEIRAKFRDDLLRVLAKPAEDAEIRTLARQAIQQ